MSYQALARKWRPQNFAEVLGQEHIVSALSNGLDNQRVHHAFLFTGTRGVGKTTLARIFAKALNCEQGICSTPCGKCVPCRGVEQGNFIDLIEVDAASRTKVDDTRELLDNVQYTPTQGRFKIYLIDEVHMLSTHSFNALLKTLEEPPEHVKFLLATTDPQKLPTTILSRCIQFNLKALDLGKLTELLEKILQSEEVEYEPVALQIIARSAYGSARDALSLLDQGIAFGNGKVCTEAIRTMLGMIDDEFIHQLLTQVCGGQSAEALQTVATMATRSVDFGTALDEMLTMLHNVALYQVSSQAVEWKGVETADLSELAQHADAELLQLFYQICLIGKRDLAFAADPRSGFEMIVLRMISFRPDHRPAPRPEPRPENRSTVADAKTATDSASSGAGYTSHPHTINEPPLPTDTTSASAHSATHSKTAKTANEVDSDTEWITLERLAAGNCWADYITQSGLTGLSRQMMMNTVLKSVDGSTLHLVLDVAHSHLLNDARVQKVATHFTQKFAQDIQLAITTSDRNPNAEATPSQQLDNAKQQKQQAAEQSFSQAPNVKELVDLFNAEVVSDSIRPSAG